MDDLLEINVHNEVEAGHLQTLLSIRHGAENGKSHVHRYFVVPIGEVVLA